MNAMLFVWLGVNVCVYFTEMGDTLEFNDIHTEVKGSWVSDAKLSRKYGGVFYGCFFFFYMYI